MSKIQRLGLILGLIFPLVIACYPALDLPARLALSVIAFAVIFWTFEPVPIPYTAILILGLFPLLKIIPFDLTFNAFSGKAVWLVFSGMALSLGITETPLSARLAHLVLDRIGTYNRLILGLHVLGLVMALLIPSGVVRVLILMPMVVSLLKSIGETPDSKVSAALILSTVCATYYGGVGILTASVPNLVVMGALESHGFTVYWSQWILYMFPVIGILRVGFIYVLIRLIFRPQHMPNLKAHPNTAHPSEHLTDAEKKVLGILLLGIALWATDVLHGVHPVFIGLVLILLIYLPHWGPLPFDTLKKVNFPLLIYIAAVFAMGHALDRVGLNAQIASMFTAYLNTLTSPLTTLGVITLLTVPFNFLMDTAAVAGVLTPLMLDLGTQLNLPPLPVALSVAIGTGVVFLPYQSAPFVVAYSFRWAKMSQFILAMTLISLLTLLLLLPLTLLYWHTIGFV